MQNFNVHGRMVAENDRPGVVSRGGLILIQLWVCSGERRGGVGSTSGERRILRGGDESPQKKNDRTKKNKFYWAGEDSPGYEKRIIDSKLRSNVQ